MPDEVDGSGSWDNDRFSCDVIDFCRTPRGVVDVCE